jgi:hypothetical protein
VRDSSGIFIISWCFSTPLDAGLASTEDFSKSAHSEDTGTLSTTATTGKSLSVLRGSSDPLLAWQIEYDELTVGEQLGAGAFGSVSHQKR